MEESGNEEFIVMKQRILIIDDDMDLCRLLKNNLEQEGYYVRTCHDGAAGLKEAMSFEYQLVVLDIMLPQKNGYEVLGKKLCACFDADSQGQRRG